MFGFTQELREDTARPDEGADTKNLDKKDFYAMLSINYLLPSMTSKGVTRDYLLAVHRDHVYRVPNLEIRTFELHLKPGHLRRVGIQNNAYLVRKLGDLLQEKGFKPLGFNQYDPPEQGWLVRIARFVDPENLLEYFAEPVKPMPALSERSSRYQQVHHYRQFAAQFLFRDDKSRSNKKLWESLHNLSDIYKACCSLHISYEALEKQLSDLEQKRNGSTASMEDALVQAAVSYVSTTSDIKPEVLMGGGEKLTPAQRNHLLETISL